MEALARWIEHVFNHPVSKPEWYWSEGAANWPEDCIAIPDLMADTFERSGELLACFPDDRIDLGFRYAIGDSSPGDFTEKLLDKKIPIAARLRAIRSFLPLFEQFMAVRCTPCLSHLDEEPANLLKSSCYMWWDMLRFRIWDTRPVPQDPTAPHYAPLFAEIVATMRGILAIPHDACRESALHGLGHLSRDYPQCREEFAGIIDDFLTRTSNLRPELIAYAERARVGGVQ